jgi:CRISPR-associated protein Csm1
MEEAQIPYYYDVLYGALLHDIGKFIWRADKTQPERYTGLTQEDLGRNGAHAKWSAQFFVEHLQDNLYESVHNEIIENLILYHHNPTSESIRLESISRENFVKLARIVQVADHASSGERIERGDENRGDTRLDVMHSIFSSIELRKGSPPESYYSIKELSVTDNPRMALFPLESKQKAYGEYAHNTQPLYKKVLTNFVNELKALISNGEKITFPTVVNLCLKYFLNIPSATFINIPDISLFNHLKSTVAISACLLLDLLAHADNELENIRESDITKATTEHYLLMEGNISGIQNFIYSIASKGAAKGLKGRSFFIKYLGELLSSYIFERLNLPLVCEIYCGGGNFYSIIPKCYEQDLEDAKLDIKHKLMDVFKGELFVDIDWIGFNRHNFSIEPPENELSFGDLWAKINAKVGKAKFQRYSDILDEANGYEQLFKPRGVGGKEEKVCSICKQEKSRAKLAPEERKCLLCQDFEDLTKKILNTNYIVYLSIPSITAADFEYELENIKDFSRLFGKEYILCEDLDEVKNILPINEDHINIYNEIVVVTINNTDLSALSREIKSPSKDLPLHFGFEFLNKTIPTQGSAIKDFDKIVEDSRTIGDNKLGLLRMDIDGLGSIFSSGLEYNSLSRLSSLSLRLKLFFKYWINEICRGNISDEDLSENEYIHDINTIHDPPIDFIEDLTNRIKNNLYLLYASGDDLFLIGHWNDIILLSELIQQIFTQYVGKNQNITISGGVAVVHPKFPLYQGASLAGSAEEKAKSNQDKNSICILGEVYKWSEYRKLSLMKEKLFYYTKKNLRKNFFHKLLQIYQMYYSVYKSAHQTLRSNDPNPVLVQSKKKINLYYKIDDNVEKTAREAAYYSRWYWAFVYYMKRTVDNNKSLRSELEDLENQIIKKRMIQNLYMPVRWAELLTKSVSKSSK